MIAFRADHEAMAKRVVREFPAVRHRSSKLAPRVRKDVISLTIL